MDEIKTERLVIRGFRESDGEALYEYLSDPVVAHSDGHEPFDLPAALAEAKRRETDTNFRAVCLDGRLIGNIWLCPGDFDAFELGYVFNRSFWGKGYAYESARAVIADAFENRGARRVNAMCNPENPRSWRLMERLGMRREGVLRRNVYFFTDGAGNPLWQDTYEYAVLKEEFGAPAKTHAEKAKELFMSGYGCAQSVFGAFCDVTGCDFEAAMKLSSSFGGGMGRMREVCGACSGMFMVAGALYGYSAPGDAAGKAAHYALIQDMARRFREKNGTIVCRELLKNIKTDETPLPTARTEDFYRTRPCLRLVIRAAEIADEIIAEKEAARAANK